jgi:hypothetical protein
MQAIKQAAPVAVECLNSDDWFHTRLATEHQAGGHTPGQYATCPRCMVHRAQQAVGPIERFAPAVMVMGGRPRGGAGSVVAFIVLLALVVCIAAAIGGSRRTDDDSK